jgi:ABC-type Fe3+/spermidine/putrescine transport system ATPase subunit
VFCNGRIEQVGSPLEVYHRPVNRFVGEFIGDSNFFTGRVDASRPGRVELAGIGEVRIAGKAPAPAGEVDVMIRPERLRLLRPGENVGTDNTLEMTLADVINYGDCLIAIGTTHGLPLRARILGEAPESLRPGASLRLAWAPTDAHVLSRS